MEDQKFVDLMKLSWLSRGCDEKTATDNAMIELANVYRYSIYAQNIKEYCDNLNKTTHA